MAIRINPYAGMNQGGGDWIDAAREIRLAKEEMRKYEGIMTPYERQTISDSIKQKVANKYNFIYQGAAAELNTAAQGYKSAVAARDKARAQEIASWDSGRFGTEMHTFQLRLNQELGTSNGAGVFVRGPEVAQRIKALFQEAQASGDRYKQRAAAEVVRSINTDALDHQTALSMRLIVRDAEQSLETLRVTPEMLTTAESVKLAAKGVSDAQELVAGVASILGESIDNLFAGGSFSKLLKTVQFDNQTGELKVYDLDSPEVTGIYHLPPKEVYPKEE